MIVTGYYKSCDGHSTCQTGWKVRCAQCTATSAAKSATAPPPTAVEANWVAPAAVTAAPGTPAPPPAAIVMPTDKPVFTAPVFDEQAVNRSTIALAAAQAAQAAAKAVLADAQTHESDVQANITKFTQEAKEEHANFQFDRDSAVRSAKKKEMANITIAKAQKDMNDAFYAEKGAVQGAQDHLAEQLNAGKQRRYYQQMLVDAMHSTKANLHNLHLGQDAVNKAYWDLVAAKGGAVNAHLQNANDNHHHMFVAETGQKHAQNMAVKGSMEGAYADSTPGTNVSDTPPWGNGNPW